MISRSYAFLTLTQCQAGRIKNLVLRNLTTSSKFLVCSSIDKQNKTPNDNLKECHLLENIKPGSTGYTEECKRALFVQGNGNVENEGDGKVSTELEPMQSVELLEKDKFDDALEDIDEKLPGPLDPCDEDLSHIGPNITATFNFAKFADQSHTIQQLVKLGVELYKLERDRDVVEMFLSLDFGRNIKPYIQFLHDCGVKPEGLGRFITRNPNIFKEDMDDLYTRIRYLRAHNFMPEMIETIINRHPPWLSFSTKDIDSRLGHFQHTFKLNGYQVRCLTVKSPKLITYDMNRIRASTFAVKEEMGFNENETKLVLLKAPRVWIRSKVSVVNSFDYLHNTMELSHAAISREPQVLLCRRNRLETRHRFLVELKRNQYDPTKPLYVSPLSLVENSDIDFCNQIAKASILTYNEFLKSF
ncbi:mitochondrial transcription termination factor 3 [Xylocopa sonorina]|uniref:mitochondrial transcription termination factor 3 n=1 Tax=Xylocopa sonorina TaxID=1818115 RepID=UPI00403AE67E